MTRRMTARHTRDGIVLGAAVGSARRLRDRRILLQPMFTSAASVTALVETDCCAAYWPGRARAVDRDPGRRAVLGLRQGRWLTGRLVLTYLWVAFLHALWDGSHDLAILVTFLLTGSYRSTNCSGSATASPRRTGVLFAVLSLGALVVVAALGLAPCEGCARERGRKRSMTDPNRPAAVNWLAGAGGNRPLLVDGDFPVPASGRRSPATARLPDQAGRCRWDSRRNGVICRVALGAAGHLPAALYEPVDQDGTGMMPLTVEMAGLYSSARIRVRST